MYELNLYILISILTKIIEKARKESYKKPTELDRIIRRWNVKTNSNIWMPLYFLYVEIKLCLVKMV